MELEILDGGHRIGRSRRNTQPNVCRPGSNETKCCLYDLMIDFEKVGWDFVIAPKRYNAYICNGECTQSQVLIFIYVIVLFFTLLSLKKFIF